MAQEQRPAGIHGVFIAEDPDPPNRRSIATRTEGSGTKDIPETPTTRMPRCPELTSSPRVACDVREMQLNHAAK